MNEREMALDLAKEPTIAPVLYLGQGDRNGTVLRVSLYDNGNVLDLDGCSVSFCMRTPGGLDYYEVVGTADGNVAEFLIDETYAAGHVGKTDEAYVSVTDPSDAISSTSRFSVVVLRNAKDGVAPAPAYVTLIEEFLENAKEDVGEAVAAAQAIVDYSVPLMSSTMRGGAKLGSGLTVEDETLSVDTSALVTQAEKGAANGVAELDQNGLVLSSQLPAAPWSSVSMCFLGDSITYGQLTSSGEHVETPWPSAMCNQLGVTDFNNAAVGGATAASGTPASSNALSQAKSLTRSYDYIFLMFGTNDYGYAVNTGSVNNTAEGTTAGGLQSAINHLQSAYQNATIVGVIPPYMPGDIVKNSAGFTALDYKKTAYQIYTSNGLPVFNFTTAMGWNANNWDYHLMPWDRALTRLHPNQASYLQMGKTIAEAFPFTTQPIWMNPTRSQSAGVIELSSGQSWKNSGMPGISWVDPFTGDVSFDLGEGITIGQDASNTIGNLKDVPKSYRFFYFSGAMFNFTTLETKPVVLAITATGGISIIGLMTGLAGWTVFASGTIPYCYFSI